jgi:two-component system, NtrC family, sensor kinase
MNNAAKKLNVQTDDTSSSIGLMEINRRILVVEDEPEIAKAYQQILTPEKIGNIVPIRKSSRTLTPAEAALPQAQIPPYDLTIAHSASEAFHYIEEAVAKGQPFAMGFIDVLLGTGIDGIELVKNIQKIDPEMYFVFVTAYQDRSVDAINELLGPQVAERWDYLNKPFSEGEIIQKARSSVSHWNLKKEKEKRDEQLADLQKRIFDSERMVSVAAVSRGMGHEFGNILVQIIGRADLAKKKSEKEMKEAFDHIIRAGEMAAKVLDRFKNLSRASTSTGTAKNLIMLSQPLEDALLLMDHQLKVSKIKICRTKSDQALIVADSSAITQVIVNLIINSVHAMATGGQLDFSVSRTPQWAELKIRDYGPGISAEHLPHVTRPFFTTKGDEGTGLGLSICKEIVEIEHAGQFSIVNHSVKGVEVTVRLPLPTKKENDL